MSVAYDYDTPSDLTGAPWCAGWPGSRSGIANLTVVPAPGPDVDADADPDADHGADARILTFPGHRSAAAAQHPLAAPAVERVPARLTRRGVVAVRSALALAVALGGALIFSLAAASHPATAPGVAAAPGTEVVVRSGDTLWSIATRVAPSADPRATVDRLIRVNHLRGAQLMPGQVLHVS